MKMRCALLEVLTKNELLSHIRPNLRIPTIFDSYWVTKAQYETWPPMVERQSPEAMITLFVYGISSLVSADGFSQDMFKKVYCAINISEALANASSHVSVYSVALDHARNQVYSGSMDSYVRIWSLVTGQCTHVLTGHTSLVGLLGLSHSYLVSAAADSTLRVWDPSTGKLRHVLAAHTGAITCFQHDDYKVVSGSDGTLKLWDIRDGSNVRDLVSGITGVWQVAFKGRWCAAATNRYDATFIDIWNFGEETTEDNGDAWEWVEETSVGSDDEDEGMNLDTTGPSLLQPIAKDSSIPEP
jgi:WD40 repeat protein